jgi:hypothetical protein
MNFVQHVEQARAARAPGPLGLERRFLWVRPEIALWDAAWDRAIHAADRVSTPTIPCFVLMRHGAYVKAVGRERAVGNPNHITLYDCDREVAVSHPSGDRTAAPRSSWIQVLRPAAPDAGARVGCAGRSGH